MSRCLHLWRPDMSELATIEPTPALDVDHWTSVLVFATRMADAVHDTEYVPTALRGRPGAVAATIVYGAEVGLTPMQALAGIHIVEGRPQPSAELMRALVFRAGHTITVHEASGTRVRVSGLRRGAPDSERLAIEWTSDMARAAGLMGRANWRSYPRAMLLARATGDLCRALFPDVIKGLGYVAEDSDTEGAWIGPEVPEVAQEKPTRKALQRSRRKTVEPEAPQLRRVEDTELPGPPPEPEAGPPVAPPPPQETPRATGGPPPGKPSEPSAWRGPYDPEDVPLPPEAQPSGSGRPKLPDPQPEASEPEPPRPGEGPKLITPGPLKALNTLLTKELGSEASEEERHGLVSAVLGRQVTSLRTLTAEQGYRVLSTFDAFAQGEAAWNWDMSAPPPHIRVVDLREPPEEAP